MKRRIEEALGKNLRRVRSLLAAYAAGRARGRRRTEDGDLLRAAVVFLHATLEDVIRSLLEWKLPAAEPRRLEDVGLAAAGGRAPRDRFTMSDLAAHRGRTVDEVIRASVEGYLLRSTFNDVGEIKRALERCGLDSSVVDTHATRMAAMIARRHRIVHRADRATEGRSGVRSISMRDVVRWVRVVESTSRRILDLV